MYQPRAARGRSSSAVKTLALAAAAGAALAFLLGCLGRWHWLLELFAPFRVQYAIVLAICAVVLMRARRPRSAILAMAVATVIAATVVGYTGWRSQPAQAAAGDFRFITFNRYMGNDDLVTVSAWLQQSRADVIALQEVDSIELTQQLAALLPGYPHVYARSSAAYGAVILSRWPIIRSETIELIPGGARVAKSVIDWQGREITVMAAHLHWPMGKENTRRRDAELQQLAQVARQSEGPMLIGGDFNVTPWSSVFRAAVAASGLQDCARGQGLATTWPAWFTPLAIRIDHCLASNDWRVVNLARGPALGSDHYAMVNDLEFRR